MLFLIKFSIGGLLGIVLFSKFVIAPLLELYPLQVSYLFLGAVAGGVPMIYKTAGVKKFSLNAVIYPVIGIILVLLINLIPDGVLTPSENLSIKSIIVQLLGGIFIAIGFILPGISLSQLLLMFGIYTRIISIRSINEIFPLIPLGIGGLIGSLLTANLMHKAMNKNPEATYLTIFGFLLGSLYQLFPGIPMGLNIPICLLTFAAGFCFIYFLQKFEK